MTAAALADRLAAASAIVNQAEHVLELLADHDEVDVKRQGGIYGAATILRAALADFEKLEIELRRSDRLNGIGDS